MWSCFKSVFCYLVQLQSKKIRAFTDSPAFSSSHRVAPESPAPNAPAGIPAGAAIDELKHDESEPVVVGPHRYYEMAKAHGLSFGELLFIVVIICGAAQFYIRMRRRAAIRKMSG